VPLRLVLVLGALTAVGPLSLTLYLPALPRLAEDLQTTDAMAQLTMTACMVGLALGQLLTGPLSDRYGRRRPLLIGVGAYTLSSVLCALAPDIGLLLGLRLVQGLGGGACIVIARAIVRDSFDTDEVARVFSMLFLVTGIAPVTAPLLGGQLVRYTSWPGLFVALGGIGALILVAAAWALRETLPPGTRGTGGIRAAGGRFAIVLRDARFVGFTGVLALGTTVLFTYLSMSPFVLQGEYGLSAQAFSFVFAGSSLGMMAVGQLGAWLVRRRGAGWTLRTGLVVAVTLDSALVVAVAAGAGPTLVLPLLMTAVAGVSLILPSASALGLAAHRSQAGTATGVMGLAQFGVSGAVAPLAAAGGTTPLLMVTTMAVAATAGLLIELVLALTAVRREAARSDVAALERQGGQSPDHGDPQHGPPQVRGGQRALAQEGEPALAHLDERVRVLEGVHGPAPQAVGGQQDPRHSAHALDALVAEGRAEPAHHAGDPRRAEQAHRDDAGRHRRDDAGQQEGQRQQDDGLAREQG
jgi:DHA1 family bicyclomycin/chloramphenicol resistance-like MFS transporter